MSILLRLNILWCKVKARNLIFINRFGLQKIFILHNFRAQSMSNNMLLNKCLLKLSEQVTDGELGRRTGRSKIVQRT